MRTAAFDHLAHQAWQDHTAETISKQDNGGEVAGKDHGLPGQVNPVGQMGAMQKPADRHQPEGTARTRKNDPQYQDGRQLSEAARITCLGLKRVAAGMEIKRPMVNASQKAESGRLPGDTGEIERDGVGIDPTTEVISAPT